MYLFVAVMFWFEVCRDGGDGTCEDEGVSFGLFARKKQLWKNDEKADASMLRCFDDDEEDDDDDDDDSGSTNGSLQRW